jgi:D-glycero-D-manno-heptose 1,7-bisphosphate phosphatase
MVDRTKMRRAVFLDRDGVINRALVRNGRPYAPTCLEEFEMLSDASDAIRSLHRAGFILVVVTNQPDVGKGLVSKEAVERMHEELRRLLPIDDIQVCYSTEGEQSFRRKPRPGMLLDAAAGLNIDLSRSFMVGDRWRDIEAGRAAGCRTILVQNHYDEKPALDPDHVVRSLSEAAQIILKSADSTPIP